MNATPEMMQPDPANADPSKGPSRSSAVEVHREAFEDVRDDVMRLLAETRAHTVDASRFDWLYLGNPDGPAVLWTVRGAESGELAGFTVCLPRRVVVEGTERRAWNGADFSMNPAYRTLGPAVKLRRAARKAIDAGEADLLYAHPNERMALIHGRVGHRPVGTMQRLARVIRFGPHLADRLGSWAGKLAGRPADVVHGLLRDPATRHRGAHELEVLESLAFDESYDELFEVHRTCRPAVGVRDGRYLQWRYAECPLYPMHAMVARASGGRPAGFVLWHEEDDTAYIKDLFPPDPQVAADLLAGLVREGKRRGWRSLSITLLEGHPLVARLAAWGFRPRAERSQMYSYHGDNLRTDADLFEPSSWLVTVGDRDV